MATITITKLEPKGEKIVLLSYTVGGKNGPVARAWASQAKDWKEGQEIEVEWEKRKGYKDGDPEELWVKAPARARGGFGGGKPQRTPEEAWSIVAQTCIKSASDIQIALINADPSLAKGFDINKVCGWADDLFDQARDKVKKAVGNA